MNEILNTQKEQIVSRLFASVSQFQEAGFGQVVDTSEMTLIDIDLSSFAYLDKGAKAYLQSDKYIIVDAEGSLIYAGHVDKGDAVNTLTTDLTDFPHLIEVSILLGKGDTVKMGELFDDASYLLAYCGETFGGMIKAHDNGHIDIQEELNKALT